MRWPFETVGATTPDATGSHAGTVTSATQIADGRFGSGLALSSATSAVTTAPAADLEPAAVTATVWVRNPGLPSRTGALLTYGQRDTCAAGSSYGLAVDGSGNVVFSVKASSRRVRTDPRCGLPSASGTAPGTR